MQKLKKSKIFFLRRAANLDYFSLGGGRRGVGTPLRAAGDFHDFRLKLGDIFFIFL